MADGAGECKGKVEAGKKVRYLTSMTISYSKVTSKSQTVIPRAVRERLGLRPGIGCDIP